MSDISRYDLINMNSQFPEPGMYAMPHGEWVQYRDYVALQQENKQLKEENEELKQPVINETKITEIIPKDLPDWAKESFETGQFFRVAIEKVAALEVEIDELKWMREGLEK